MDYVHSFTRTLTRPQHRTYELKTKSKLNTEESSQ